MFIDEATIEVRSGEGGQGCISFRREKYIPRGGPDGGRGGHGGHVFLQADDQLSTLLDLSRQRHYSAGNGKAGGGNNRTGKRGEDVTVHVPVGTIVREVRNAGDSPEDVTLLGDLTADQQRLRVARGGRGGLGNKAFAHSTHQTPRVAQDGQTGETRTLYLELRLIADVGLVGLPNAGKSTLLSRVSAATPKIANYPFTTLHPHLGIVELSDYRRMVMADIPGIIEGAHEGQGLGIEFLRHIERTRVLLHLVSAEEGDVESLAASYEVIDRELQSYSQALAERARLVVVSKVDVLASEEVSTICTELSKKLERPVLPLSAVTGKGLQTLLDQAATLLASAED